MQELYASVYHKEDIHRSLPADGAFIIPDRIWTMNSTSFESRHAQYKISTLAAPAQEAENPREPLGLYLTSSPRFSFKAPTAEDFDKGSRALMEESTPGSVISMFYSLWNKLVRR